MWYIISMGSGWYLMSFSNDNTPLNEALNYYLEILKLARNDAEIANLITSIGMKDPVKLSYFDERTKKIINTKNSVDILLYGKLLVASICNYKREEKRNRDINDYLSNRESSSTIVNLVKEFSQKIGQEKGIALINKYHNDRTVKDYKMSDFTEDEYLYENIGRVIQACASNSKDREIYLNNCVRKVNENPELLKDLLGSYLNDRRVSRVKDPNMRRRV